MTVVRLLSLEITSFRGISSFVFTPNGENAAVFGANGTGKSTLANAFLWLLTGKDMQGRDNYNIFPLDEKGQRLTGCTPCVTAVLSEDGVQKKFARKLCEKWSKKRGSLQTEYCGDETVYHINDAPCSAREYTAEIESICPAQMLALMLNASYFSEQTKDYRERRKLLLQQFGALTPDDVFAANPSLSELREMLGAHSVEEYARICAERRKLSKEALVSLPARIDENRQQLPSEQLPDAESITTERSQINVKIAKLRYEIEHLDAAEIMRGYQQEVHRLQMALAEIPAKRRILAASDSADWAENHAQHLQVARRICSEKANELSQAEQELQKLQTDLIAESAKRNRLRSDWSLVNSQKITVNEICPSCGQPLPPEGVRIALENLHKEQSNKLDEIAAEGRAAAEKVDDLTASIMACKHKCKAARDAVQEANENAEKIIAEQPPVSRPDLYADLDAAQTDLQTQLEVAQQQAASSADALNKAAAEIQKQIDIEQASSDELTQQLIRIRQVDEIKQRIRELDSERKTTLGQLEDAEKGIALCESYQHALTELLTERVNEHFDTVQFRLFEQQKNGGTREICEAAVDGVPYGALNTAAKMQANLEIVRAFSTKAGISLPLFLDNRESVTDLPEPEDMQIINLAVDPAAKKIKIEGEE